MDKFHSLKDKFQSAISYVLLEYSLFKFHNIDILNVDALYYNEYKKPFLKRYPNIFFNISHCDNGVCCGISNYGNIGVDIQNIVPIKKSIMDKILTDNEILTLNNLNDFDKNFTRIWTLKESYLKYLGTGFLSNPKNIEFLNNSLSFKQDSLSFKSIPFNDCFISSCSLMDCNIKLIEYNSILNFITNRR